MPTGLVAGTVMASVACTVPWPAIPGGAGEGSLAGAGSRLSLPDSDGPGCAGFPEDVFAGVWTVAFLPHPEIVRSRASARLQMRRLECRFLRRSNRLFPCISIHRPYCLLLFVVCKYKLRPDLGAGKTGRERREGV